MENASKALLIAGAILLVIALIAIGMAILGQGQDVVNSTADNFDALTVQAYNNQFAPYLNKELSASEYNRLRGLATNYSTTGTAAGNHLAAYNTLNAGNPIDLTVTATYGTAAQFTDSENAGKILTLTVSYRNAAGGALVNTNYTFID